MRRSAAFINIMYTTEFGMPFHWQFSSAPLQLASLPTVTHTSLLFTQLLRQFKSGYQTAVREARYFYFAYNIFAVRFQVRISRNFPVLWNTAILSAPVIRAWLKAWEEVAFIDGCETQYSAEKPVSKR